IKARVAEGALVDVTPLVQVIERSAERQYRLVPGTRRRGVVGIEQFDAGRRAMDRRSYRCGAGGGGTIECHSSPGSVLAELSGRVAGGCPGRVFLGRSSGAESLRACLRAFLKADVSRRILLRADFFRGRFSRAGPHRPTAQSRTGKTPTTTDK